MYFSTIRVVSPGTAFDSWTMVGIESLAPSRSAGKLA